jgi:hypothetical protein
MLAYVFWHRPAAGVTETAYEQALTRFHRSLAARPPAGFAGGACLRAATLPWLGGEGPSRGAGRPGYEDWYLVEDFAALGVLNAAAVARGHLGAHDEAARRAGSGTGGVYRLLEGHAVPADARVAVWIDKPRGAPSPVLGALLGDGMDAARAALWQRQLALGPAPEYCMLAVEAPAGVAPSRLAPGWSASADARAAL